MLETITRELQCMQDKVSEEQADRGKVAEYDNAVAFYRRQLKDMGINVLPMNYDMETVEIESAHLGQLVPRYVKAKIQERVKEITDSKAQAMLTEGT